MKAGGVHSNSLKKDLVYFAAFEISWVSEYSEFLI